MNFNTLELYDTHTHTHTQIAILHFLIFSSKADGGRGIEIAGCLLRVKMINLASCWHNSSINRLRMWRRRGFATRCSCTAPLARQLLLPRRLTLDANLSGD